MIKAVLDTNVIISALFWRGAPFLILRKAIKGDFLFLSSPNILKEVKDKLISKFNFPKEKTDQYLKILIVNCELINPEKKLRVVEDDPSDNKIVECADEGKASLIISGDNHLRKLKRYKDIKIVSPAQALKILGDKR